MKSLTRAIGLRFISTIIAVLSLAYISYAETGSSISNSLDSGQALKIPTFKNMSGPHN